MRPPRPYLMMPSMSVDECLHTVFDGADCEYVDGEIVERKNAEPPLVYI